MYYVRRYPQPKRHLDRLSRCCRAHYCDRQTVCLSICHSSEPCKTAQPIEIPFGLRTRMGPRNHVLDGGPDPPMGSGNFEGGPLQSIGTQFTAESPYTLQWAPLSTRIAPSFGGTRSHLTHDALGQCELKTKTAPQSVQPCLHI